MWPEGAASGLVATCYDDRADLLTKYDDATAILSDLDAAGARVLCNVDATALCDAPRLLEALPRSAKGEIRLDKIVFNFPHTGCGIKDTAANVRHHQDFLRSFFESAADLIGRSKPTSQHNPVDGGMFDSDDSEDSEDEVGERDKRAGGNSTSKSGRKRDGAGGSRFGGKSRRSGRSKTKHCEVHLTIKRGEPYNSWGLARIGRDAGFQLLNALDFFPSVYPGYEHRRTLGAVSAEERSAGHRLSLRPNEDIDKQGARTFVFGHREKIMEEDGLLEKDQRGLMVKCRGCATAWSGTCKKHTKTESVRRA